MDWYTIEYLYPNALSKFKERMFPNVGVLSLSTLVYLSIEMYNPHQWVFSISLHNGIVFGPTQESKKTREEAEEDGFFECFRVLDMIIIGKVS
jgi:hypothetical protein